MKRTDKTSADQANTKFIHLNFASIYYFSLHWVFLNYHTHTQINLQELFRIFFWIKNKILIVFGQKF